MPGEPHTTSAIAGDALRAGLPGQGARAAHALRQLLLADLEAERSPAADGGGRPWRVRADAVVLRSQLARVRHGSWLVESCIRMRRGEPARRHDFDNRKTTTTMEVS